MTGMLKKAVLGGALAATALTAAAPAEAQRYRGGYGRHDRGIGSGGAAVLGGLVGLGIGAAIASNNNRGGYYDRGYADDGYYYDSPRVVYRDRYYAPPRVVYRDRYDRGYPRGYYRPYGYYGY